MNFTSRLIERYAKKIYAFAYAKARDLSDAEDLAQEIAVALCGASLEEKTIGNMDGYVCRVCRYCWANHLRKNLPQRRALQNAGALDTLASGDDVAGDCERRALHETLRREIMYLGRLRREITVMFYFDGKSGGEIARALGIPAGTVRWHLSRVKTDLKERIDTETSDTIYRPVRLAPGWNGRHGSLRHSGQRADAEYLLAVSGQTAHDRRDRPHTRRRVFLPRGCDRKAA